AVLLADISELGMLPDGRWRALAQPASMSSDRIAQRGTRFVGQGEGPNIAGILFASSAVRCLPAKTHRCRGTILEQSGRHAGIIASRRRHFLAWDPVGRLDTSMGSCVRADHS